MSDSMTDVAPQSPESVIAELINAAEAVRLTMYENSLEVAWAPAGQRWRTAVDQAEAMYPGITALLES